MINLTDYILENGSNVINETFINESMQLFENGETLTDVYESLFEPMFLEDGMIDEGLLKKLGGLLKKGAEKAEDIDAKLEEIKKNADEKIEEFSSEAKEAIAKLKERLKNKWEDAKAGVILVIEHIEAVFKKTMGKIKGAIEAAAKAAGVAAISTAQLIFVVAKGLVNMINKATGAVKDFATRTLNDSKTLVGYTMLNFGIMIALKCDLNNEEIQHTLNLAVSK